MKIIIACFEFLLVFAPTWVEFTCESTGRYRTSSHPATGVHCYPVMVCFMFCFVFFFGR